MTSCFYFPLAWINWVPLILSIYFFAGIDSLINRKWPSSERLAGRIFRPCFFAVHVSIFVCLWISIFTSWTILWGKIVWSVCLQNKTTMAESYPLSGQYSPDHRNPYRTNEAFHFDPDEEEKLAGHLEGIITRFLLNRFIWN